MYEVEEKEEGEEEQDWDEDEDEEEEHDEGKGLKEPAAGLFWSAADVAPVARGASGPVHGVECRWIG